MKNPNEKQRKQISEFTAAALEGNYDAVYLSEIKRGVEGDPLSREFTSDLIHSCRYGKIDDKHLLRMRELFATQDDIAQDDRFLESRMIHGFHYFSENDPTRKSVESDNIRTMFDLANRMGGKPIVHIKAMHIPENKAASLERVSAKEFEGMMKNFVAYEGMPTTLLQNIAPQYGLFNGAICKFRGLLYLPDNINVKLRSSDFKNMKMKNLVVQHALDLKGVGAVSQVHKLPKGSVLVTVNNRQVLSDNDAKTAFEATEAVNCQFQLPKTPPNLPDFIVIECDEYKDRGGPNILGFAGAENLIPIPRRRVKREGKGRDKTWSEFRLGFMLECALAVTAYKLQGKNEKCATIQMKDFAHVPGLFLVSISRTKHPKDNHIPDGQYPTALDINLQRLNSFVVEAEIFERVVKLMALRTLRKYTIEKNKNYGQAWNMEDAEIANYVEAAYKKGVVKTIPPIKEFINVTFGKHCEDEDLRRVIDKIDSDEARVIKEELPYLKDEEYIRLVAHKKQKKKRTR